MKVKRVYTFTSDATQPDASNQLNEFLDNNDAELLDIKYVVMHEHEDLEDHVQYILATVLEDKNNGYRITEFINKEKLTNATSNALLRAIEEKKISNNRKEVTELIIKSLRDIGPKSSKELKDKGFYI